MRSGDGRRGFAREWAAALPSPKWGKVAPQGRMRDELAKSRARTGNHRRAAPHPPSGGASGTFPQGGEADNVNLRVGKKEGYLSHERQIPLFYFAYR